MVRRQQGLTLMSFVLVLAVVGFFALITMKLFPMYTEYNSVKSVMKAFAANPASASMTPAQAYSDLERRFDIGYVTSVRKEHIKIVRTGRVTQLNIAYEVRKPLFANLDIVGKFDNTVDLGGAGQAASE
jgi:Tfp pilus assembly major pilin PilA